VTQAPLALRAQPRYLTVVATEMSDSPVVQAGGLKTKTLAIIGAVTAGLWAWAIYTGSLVFMIIMGVLTLVLLVLLFFAWRMSRKQTGLAAMLQQAQQSPESRRAALAKLSEGKDKNDVTNVFIRAQLIAQDDPAAAMAMLEPLSLKQFPPQMQDDVALLKTQLYLNFGRPKDARPLVDQVNLESPQRAEQRPLMVSLVAQAWARTGKHNEAASLLESVDFNDKKNEQIRSELLVARVFARFAGGKRDQAKQDLQTLAQVDVNHLGRFLAPQLRVHPELQRLVRQVAESRPEVRKQARARQPRPR
jgi:hypothetical protein